MHAYRVYHPASPCAFRSITTWHVPPAHFPQQCPCCVFSHSFYTVQRSLYTPRHNKYSTTQPLTSCGPCGARSRCSTPCVTVRLPAYHCVHVPPLALSSPSVASSFVLLFLPSSIAQALHTLRPAAHLLRVIAHAVTLPCIDPPRSKRPTVHTSCDQTWPRLPPPRL